MNTSSKSIQVTVLALLVSLVSVCALVFKQPVIAQAPIESQIVGAASLEGAYSYRHITSADASATVVVQVRGGAGVLGSITVGSTSPAFSQGIRVYDGTNATTSSTSTLMAKINASAAEQTYIFDAATKNGIVLDVPAAFNGSMTISYK